MGKRPLIHVFGELLGTALRIGYNETLQPEMGMYLQLSTELAESASIESKVLFEDVHDAIKNAMNHFGVSSEDCIDNRPDAMIRNIQLGMWHLNIARTLTLMPCMDHYEVLINDFIEQSKREERAVAKAVLTELNNITRTHLGIDARIDKLMYGKGPTMTPRPPTEAEIEELVQLNSGMVEIISKYNEIIILIRPEYSVKELRNKALA